MPSLNARRWGRRCKPRTPYAVNQPAGDDRGPNWEQAMRRGDLGAAWAISDQVLRERDPSRRDDASLPYHERWVWDGRSFDGADVLVRCYHGLGDTLQFARYLPALWRAIQISDRRGCSRSL